MVRRYELTDDECNRIVNLLPPENTGKPERPPKENRNMLNVMVWLTRSVATWRCQYKDPCHRRCLWESCISHAK